ncbi:MAG TPA: DNA primase [Allosphingosinicella sp.]|nr:DNA primase [Allosphingosinicella sp.]
MTLSPAFLDELRARTTLSSLISRSVKLQKAGREYKAPCPFHKEKTPSFYVNDEKGFYHCFGCSAHGDAIRWLTDARGLPFMDAVKELADAAGIEVPAPDPRAQAKAERAAGLYEVMEAAQAWFADQLGGIEGAAARAYLETRGVSAATVRKFGFGFAPDARGKLKAALGRFGNDSLIEAGLLIQPEGEEREPYDRFRGRLTFPIRDRRGRVIAFSARILGAGEPKYLNSPDTPLFDKGRSLFNIDKAAAASRQAERVIIVEGQMDVIALDQAGISEAVAPLGTALTDTQLGLLWRLSPTPLLCFDGDAAGQKAAFRAALRALPHVGPGRSLTFATLPPGQDPDDIVRGSGRGGFEALLAAAEPLVERLWRHERQAEPLDTPERKAGLRRRLLDHAAAISDPDVRDQYRADLMQRYSELTRPPPRRPWTPGGLPGRPFVPQQPVSAAARGVASGGIDPRMVRAVLRGLLLFPEAIADHGEAIAALPITDAAARRLREELLGAAMSHAELDRTLVHTILAASDAASLAEKLRRTRGLAFSFTRRDGDPERALRDLVLVIDTLAAQPGLDAALAAATSRLKDEGDDAAFQEQQRLLRARGEADRQLAALVESEAEAKTEQGV